MSGPAIEWRHDEPALGLVVWPELFGNCCVSKHGLTTTDRRSKGERESDIVSKISVHCRLGLEHKIKRGNFIFNVSGQGWNYAAVIYCNCYVLIVYMLLYLWIGLCDKSLFILKWYFEIKIDLLLKLFLPMKMYILNGRNLTGLFEAQYLYACVFIQESEDNERKKWQDVKVTAFENRKLCNNVSRLEEYGIVI